MGTDMIKQYLVNILISLDQLVNSILFGDPRETISSRSDKAMQEGKQWGCILCKFLALFQKDHCQKAVDPTVGDRAVIKD
jgi:hypothetical protein